jgi:hypothetical protein
VLNRSFGFFGEASWIFRAGARQFDSLQWSDACNRAHLYGPFDAKACLCQFRASTVAFPEYTKRLRDDRDVHNFHDLAPHVYAQADFDIILIADEMLSPSAVELVAGVGSNQRFAFMLALRPV